MGLISWVKDLVDANSEEDRRKRVARGDAEWYADYQKQKGNSRVSNNPWQRAVNTTKATVDNASKVYDTLNIFDNGLSYKTRKVNPNAVMSTGEQFRDLLDSDTKKDQYNRYKKTFAPWKIPQSYEEQQKQMGNMRPFVNPAQQIVGNSARAANTIKQFPSEVVDTTRVGIAQLTNNEEALDAINRQILERQSKAYDPKSGLLNAGTWYDNAEQAQQSTTGDSFKRGGLTMLGTAGELFPVGRGIKLTGQIANASLRKGAQVGASQYFKVAGQGAAANAAAEAGNMQMQYGRVDPLALAGAAGAGAVMSVAPPLIYRGFQKTAPNTALKVEQFADSAAKNTTKAVQGARNAVKNVGSNTKKGVQKLERKINPNLEVLAENRKNAQIAYDREANPKVREEIGRYLAEINKEYRKEAQRGGAQFNPSESPIARALGGDDPVKAKNLARRYKNAYIDELTPEQNAAVADYADFLRSMGEGNGVVRLEDGRRVSNNALRPDNNGKRMNNTEWFDWAYENLKSGKAEPGAQDMFNQAGRPKLPEILAPDAEQRVFAQNPMNTARKTTQAIPEAPQETPLLSQGVDPRTIEATGTTTQRQPKKLSDKTNLRGQTTAVEKTGKPQDLQKSLSNRPKEVQGLSPQEQAQANPQAIQKPDTSAPRSRPNTAKSSPTNVADNTIDDAISPEFNAAVTTKSGKFTDKFVEAMVKDQKLTEAVKKAQLDGSELHFFSEKARNDAYKLRQFDPQTHRIEAGFVVDSKGNALGNHVKVDSTGIQVNVGGDLINMESIIGDPAAWAKGRTKYLKMKQRYRLSETQSRNIDANAPTKEIAERTKEWLVGNKYNAEAKFRTEVDVEYKKLSTRISNVEKAKPTRVPKKQYKDDIFGVLNGDITDATIRKTYPKQAADAILTYKKETRALYNSLLERINTERVKFGQRPIDARKDYITHLQELNGDKSFVGDIANSIRNSFTDDGMQKTRKGVPANIVGLTETFEPKSAYNKFLQRRTGDKALRDPFLAVQEYIEPALYNIHMTEPTVRARAITTAFRTATELQQMKPDELLKNTRSLIDKYQKGMVDSKLTDGFNEYANALARKTQRGDRVLTDMSSVTALGLREWQRLQRVGGRATILGNVSSMLAQPLNQAVGLADAGVDNWLKGLARTVTRNSSIEKSPFITARRIKANKPIRGAFDKTMDVGGVPLQKVEMASIEIIWNSQHAKALSKGHKGAKAISVADMNTERLVAGRGIADRPELYRSTAANGVLQYTLEVMAQHKAVWKDLSPTQKATFVATAAAMNLVYGQVTGYEPLPDFLKAAVDTGKDFMNEDDDRSGAEKAINAAQRTAGEYVGMNPIGTAAANTLLDQNKRKTLFGDESDLGRFEGTAAPIKVVQNGFNATNNFIQGNTTQGRNDLLRTIPFGNQARKTITGAEMLQNGYAVDSKGNPTYAAPESTFDKAKALLFGPSSTSQAKTYYDSDGRRISGKGDLDTIKNSGDPRKTVQAIQDARAGKTDGLKTVADKTERDISGNIVSRDKYDAMLDAYTKDKAGNLKISSYDSKDLVKANREIGTELNSALDKLGLPQIKTDSTTAQIWAKYKVSERDGKIGELEKDSKQRSVFKNIYRSRVSKTANEFFGISSDAEMERIIESGKVTKEQLDEAIALDNFLTESGLQSYMQIGKELRAKLGYGSPSSSKSSRSGGSSGGRSTGLTQAELNKYLSAASKTANVDIPQFATSAPRQLARPQITQIQRRGSTSRSTAAPRVSIRKGIQLA